MAWLGLLKTRPSHMCYHAEFGRSALKGVSIIQENSQNWGALELRYLGMGGVADPEIHASSPRVTTSNSVVLRQRVYEYMEGNPNSWGSHRPRPPWSGGMAGP